MSTLLQIKTSLFGDAGQSSRLADELAARWRAVHPRGRVIVRDLAAQPIAHLSAERFSAFASKPDARTPEQLAVVQLSDELIEELRQADEIVLTAPMYNFGIPSTLKAYFDHIARAGVTFRYTESGSVGLLLNKKVTVVATRGGDYAGTAKDTATAYLRDFLAFIGLTEVEFVYAEGLAISAERQQRSLNAAREQITKLTTVPALAA